VAAQIHSDYPVMGAQRLKLSAKKPAAAPQTVYEQQDWPVAEFLVVHLYAVPDVN
jgi:hypothetical protein